MLNVKFIFNLQKLYTVLGFFSGIHGHSSSAIPVTIPAASALSPQASRSIAAQISSSCSSDAEVAELAGGSIEDSIEIKRRVEELQALAGKRKEEVESGGSDQRVSTEEEDEGDAEGI